MSQLVRYEQARTALAACHSVDEVKDIRDKAEAMAAYARQAKDQELIQYATEIKVRAERKCGELLAESVEHGGDRKTESRSKSPTLNEMGLTKDQSSRYQQLAAMPAEQEVSLWASPLPESLARRLPGRLPDFRSRRGRAQK